MIDSNEHKFLIKELVKMLKQLEQDKTCVVILIGITHLLSQVNTGVLHHFYNTKNDKDITFEYPDVSERYEILKIHTRNMTLASNFDFYHVIILPQTHFAINAKKLSEKNIHKIFTYSWLPLPRPTLVHIWLPYVKR